MTIHHETRTPFAAHTAQSDKRHAGRTELSDTKLELRSGDADVNAALRGWVFERLGRQLGKYAQQIERVQVRFGDENGPRGGEDKCCMVHVTLSKLPSVVVEMRGETEREAFDLAADRVERATRRNIERHGFSSKHGKQKRQLSHENGLSVSAEPDNIIDTSDEVSEEALFGRHSEHGAPQLTHALEDSTNGRPSRKSTRPGSHRVKADNPLTQRTKSAVLSPKAQATRASAFRTH